MKRFHISPPVTALLLAIVLFLLSGLLPNGFGKDMAIAKAQALNILRLSVFLGVIAAGQTLVIISGFEGIDLSAGSIVTLTAIFTYVIVSGQDSMVLPAFFVALLVGAFIGFLNGAGITFLKISPFVMTLGMSGVVTGAIIIANHGNVQGKVAPIMTRLIARPLLSKFPHPKCPYHLAGFWYSDVAAFRAYQLWQKPFCHRREQGYCQAIRRECDCHQPGNLFPGRDAGGFRWIPGDR